MKHIMTISIVIACLLFTGCISNEEDTSEASYYSGSVQTPDFIIKPSDVPGLTLNSYFFYAVPENEIYTSNSSPGSKYTESLPVGTRNVGEKSYWMDESGQHAVAVEIEKYDSDDGLEAMFEHGYEWIEIVRNATEHGVDIQGIEYDTYDTDACDIGTNGIYSSKAPSDKPKISYTTITFMTSNNELVTVNTIDERGKDLDEAIRIAKIVEARL
ncbi:MAG: hypothetical protein SCH66_10995 [Methanolobus sp.]|nr:hypothetical protein [Methanolobus sp.]